MRSGGGGGGGGVGHLERVVELVALAEAAVAGAAAGAERAGGGVAGPAAALLLQRGAAVRGALATLAEAARVAHAHAARRYALPAAHQRALAVRLQHEKYNIS